MIAEILSKFIDVRDEGKELRINCPWCSSNSLTPDTKKHLYVQSEVGIFNCFRCGAKGNFTQLLSELTGKSYRECQNEFTLPTPERFYGNIQKEIEHMIFGKENKEEMGTKGIKFPKWAVKITRNHKQIWKYLKKRNITLDEVLFYKLRCTEDEKYLFIPFYEDGTFVYWQCRSTINNDKIFPYKSNDDLGKSHYIFNYDGAKNSKQVIICEGWADAITIGKNAISIQGKKISDVQLQKVLTLKANWYIVFLDGDDNTIPAAKEIAERLKGFGANASIVFSQDSGKDPAELGRDECSRRIAESGNLKAALMSAIF